MDYIVIMLSTAAVYIFIIAALRIFGKKEIAQLSVIDLVFVMLIGNAVQNAMVGSDTSLFGGLVSAVTLFIMNFLFKYILYKFPMASQLMQGQTVMLIYNGKIMTDNLKKTRISMNELEEAMREHGAKNLNDVDLAVLELDGNISIISGEFQTRSTVRHKGKNQNQDI